MKSNRQRREEIDVRPVKKCRLARKVHLGRYRAALPDVVKRTGRV